MTVDPFLFVLVLVSTCVILAALVACCVVEFSEFPWIYISMFRAWIWAASTRALRACVGERIWTWFYGSLIYVVYERNPLLSLFYFFLVLGAYAVYILLVIPSAVSEKVPELINVWETGFYSVFIVFALSTWCACRFSDPGVVTFENSEFYRAHFPLDYVLYNEKTCEFCKISQPGRTKHCRACGVCIVRQDHHCPWINNCVGWNNVRLFWLFLTTHVAISGYTIYLCVSFLYRFVVKYNLFEMRFRGADGLLLPHSFWIPVHYLVFHFGAAMGLGFFALIVALVLGVFFCYHFYLGLINSTTREAARREDLADFVKKMPPCREIHVFLESKVPETANDKAIENSDIEFSRKQAEKKLENAKVAARKLLLPSGELDLSTNPLLGTCNADEYSVLCYPNRIDDNLLAFSEEARTQLAKMCVKNFYSRGMVSNLREVLFPLIPTTKNKKT